VGTRGASKKLSVEDVVHESGELAAALDTQLGVDVLQVPLDGRRRNVHRFTDRDVGGSADRARRDFGFTSAQPE